MTGPGTAHTPTAQRPRPRRGVRRAASGARLDDHRRTRQRGDQSVAGQESMARRTYAGRILADDQALLADPMQQCGMACGVWDVDAACEHRDGETVGGKGGAVCRAVDSVRAARHHRHVPLDQARGQVRGDVLAVRGARSGSDDCDGAFGYVVEARRADRPQGQAADEPAAAAADPRRRTP